jgi:hypothetical protein
MTKVMHRVDQAEEVVGNLQEAGILEEANQVEAYQVEGEGTVH